MGEITSTKFHASRVFKHHVGVTTVKRPDPKGLFTFLSVHQVPAALGVRTLVLQIWSEEL
jgi:hypothetical protein